MAKLSLAITAAFFLAMATLASAQGPTYESRGYGGPLYVGPNFQGGGQHSPPVYSPNSSSKRYKKRRAYQAAKSRKERAAKQTEQAKSSPAKGGVESENSSIARATGDADATPGGKTADPAAIENENSSISAAELSTATTTKENPPEARKNVGCKKYFPTAGMTLSVPCE